MEGHKRKDWAVVTYWFLFSRELIFSSQYSSLNICSCQGEVLVPQRNSALDDDVFVVFVVGLPWFVNGWCKMKLTLFSPVS
jgi:hypothetical protein